MTSRVLCAVSLLLIAHSRRNRKCAVMRFALRVNPLRNGLRMGVPLTAQSCRTEQEFLFADPSPKLL